MLDNSSPIISEAQLLDQWRYCLNALGRAERMLKAVGVPIPEEERNAALMISAVPSQPMPTALFDLPEIDSATPTTANFIRKACKALADQSLNISKGSVDHALEILFPGQEFNDRTVASTLGKMEGREELTRTKSGGGGIPHQYILGPKFRIE